MTSFSSTLKLAPGLCSPSRKVVSKILTLSIQAPLSAVGAGIVPRPPQDYRTAAGERVAPRGSIKKTRHIGDG